MKAVLFTILVLTAGFASAGSPVSQSHATSMLQHQSNLAAQQRLNQQIESNRQMLETQRREFQRRELERQRRQQLNLGQPAKPPKPLPAKKE